MHPNLARRYPRLARQEQCYRFPWGKIWDVVGLAVMTAIVGWGFINTGVW